MKAYLKPLIIVSAGYLIGASIGTVLAIQETLPANFGGFLHGQDVLHDFITFNGTALSPPLILMVLQAIFSALIFRPGRTGMTGIIGLTTLGSIYTLGQLGEPILWRMFNPATFDLVQALVLAVNLALSVSMIVFGSRAWRRRNASPDR